MADKSLLYGVVVVFVALLLVSSLTAAYYFSAEQQQAEAARNYARDLNGTISQYSALHSSLGVALENYNSTLSLLVQAAANLNTSTPAYQNVVSHLAGLWKSYLNLTESYRGTFASYSTDMLVDYGNGTRVWYNDTRIQPGWNLYTTTLVLLKGNIQAELYSTFQPPEHFIYGINGVLSSKTTGWFLWVQSGGGWQVSQAGADSQRAYNGTVFAWTLCQYDQNYNPTCTP